MAFIFSILVAYVIESIWKIHIYKTFKISSLVSNEKRTDVFMEIEIGQMRVFAEFE
jgi:hypothetical protein